MKKNESPVFINQIYPSNLNQEDQIFFSSEIKSVVKEHYQTWKAKLGYGPTEEIEFIAFIVPADMIVSYQIVACDANGSTHAFYSAAYSREKKIMLYECEVNKIVKEVYNFADLAQYARDKALAYQRCYRDLVKILDNRSKSNRNILDSLRSFLGYVVNFNTRYGILNALGALILTNLCYCTMPIENLTKDVVIGMATVFSIFSCLAKTIHTALATTEYKDKQASEIAVRIGGIVLSNLAIILPVTYLSYALFIGLGTSILDAASGALLFAFIANIAVNHVYDKYVNEVSSEVTAFLTSFASKTVERS